MAAQDAIVTFIYNGQSREDIPDDATHIVMHESVTEIPNRLFFEHPNIVEVYCHEGVEKVGRQTFGDCRYLLRVIMLGVTEVEFGAFLGCLLLRYVEAPKLKRIGGSAFQQCFSLSDINLKSVEIVEASAFVSCKLLRNATFGKNLRFLGQWVFYHCRSIEKITIPLKRRIAFDGGVTFSGCTNLSQIDLIERAMLQETIDALLLEDWRNDMNSEVNSINEILSVSRPREGEAIRVWIASLLDKIIDYKALHRSLVNEAATILKLVLQNDIVTNNICPFLELPLHRFDGENND